MFLLLKSSTLEHTLAKTNKLRNIYTIQESEEHLNIEMGKLLFQNLNHPVYHKF